MNKYVWIVRYQDFIGVYSNMEKGIVGLEMTLKRKVTSKELRALKCDKFLFADIVADKIYGTTDSVLLSRELVL